MANNGGIFLPAQSSTALAWLFPGQGSQEVGMGRDLWQDSPAARKIFDTADAALGYSISNICFEGPEDKLKDTRVTQPAIVTVSLACLAGAIESGAIAESPAWLAGHSVGEYTALIVSGALTVRDGIKLVQERARLMAEASEAHPGTLAAIIGLDEAAVRAICEEADADVCNLNLPNQTVVGGSLQAVARVIEKAKALGASRAIELNVSGAFHSRLMKSAETGMAAAVAAVAVADPLIPVVGNLSAGPLTTAMAVRTELCRQVTSPVRWHESIAAIAAAGVSSFIEFGAGRVLTGMVRRLQPNATLVNISGSKSLAPEGAGAQG